MTRFLLAALLCVGSMSDVVAQAPPSQTPATPTAPGRSRLLKILERATEDTRRIVFFARLEVGERGSAAIAPEHFLLGIIREGKGPAYDLLFEKFALDVTSLKADMESTLERNAPLPTSTEVPFTASARQVLMAAVREADRLEQDEIRPEHLLLGILQVTDSIPAVLLAKRGVTLESARERLLPVGSAEMQGASAPQSTESFACEVTKPNGQYPLGSSVAGRASSFYGNESVATTLWPDGTITFRPGGPGFVLADGALQMKFLWAKARLPMTIEGRRLDAPAPPLQSDIHHAFDGEDFQPSALIFPTPGCWEVTSHVGKSALTFVTKVVKIGEGR